MKNYFRSISPLQFAFAMMVFAIAAACLLLGHYTAAVMIAPVGAADIEALALEMKTAQQGFTDARKDLQAGYDELKAKMGEQGTKISTELKADIDKVITEWNLKFGGVKGEFDALEQKMALRKGEPDSVKSWGEQFVEGTQFKSASEAGSMSAYRGRIGQEVKQVNSAAAGGLIRSLRETEVTNLLRERRVVRDLLRTVPIATSSVDYAVQTVRTNAAAPVAEGDPKPYSDYAWGSATVVVRTLAHLAKITRQAMDDAPRLVGEIDSEMRYGLGYVEERQFLYGTGVGQNLFGIMPQATAFAVPAGFALRPAAPGVTKIDVLRVAMLQNSLALLPADGIVLHEVDWADIELTKTTDGAYLFAIPQGSVEARMWALPIVATPAMTAGDFLVGAFKMGATVYDRMAVEVLISTENVDDFEKNLATMRAEERVAIAVKRPQAFTKGTFTTAITALTAP
jgi:HK97 family phage major capsid protein